MDMEVLPTETNDSMKDDKPVKVNGELNGSVEGMEVDEEDVATDESVYGSSRAPDGDGEVDGDGDPEDPNSRFGSEIDGKSTSHFESEGEGKNDSEAEGKLDDESESEEREGKYGSDYGAKSESQNEGGDVDGFDEDEAESMNSDEEYQLLNSDNEQGGKPRTAPADVPAADAPAEPDSEEEGDINGPDEEDDISSLKDDKEAVVEEGNGEKANEDLERTPEKESDISPKNGTPSKKKKKDAEPITPRRSSRTVQKPQRFGQGDGETDEEDGEDDGETEEASDGVEEIPGDPLADAVIDKENHRFPRMIGNTTIVMSDGKRLSDMASARASAALPKKEPTLVIIDTNSILSGRGGVPMQTAGGVTITQQPSRHPPAVHAPHQAPIAPKPRPPPPILPTLTDDMYVVEAPSFIVPYVYEKPPVKKFRKYLKRVLKEVRRQDELEEELRKKEEEEEEEEKKKAEGGVSVKKEVDTETDTEIKSELVTDDMDLKKEIIDGDNEKEKMEIDENRAELDKDKAKMEVDKDSAELDKDKMDVDDPDKETPDQTKVDAKEATKAGTTEDAPLDLEKVKKEPEKEKKDASKDDSKVDESSESEEEATEEEAKKKPATGSYFDNPLGKFFMQIGMNLVQEFVQTDLLKQQKKKQKAGKGTEETQMAIVSLKKNLILSKENNEPYAMEQTKCEFCSFKTESNLIMAHHLETPHMRNYVYRCNFCPLEVRGPHDILYHMEAEHCVRGRLERAPAFHQCPQCPFEDNQKGKLTRHLMTCGKKFRPEKNLEPPLDWEPPAKIPRLPRKPNAIPMGVNNPLYAQAMAKNMSPQLLPKVPAGSATAASQMRPGRGRPMYPPMVQQQAQKLMAQRNPLPPQLQRGGVMYRNPAASPVMLPSPYPISNNPLYQMRPNQLMGLPNRHLTLPDATPALPALKRLAMSSWDKPDLPQPEVQQKNPATVKLLNQPSISITPLPRQSGSPQAGIAPARPGQAGSANPNAKTTFVICEICDGYIKDLEQLRNHMQWIHKVKIHPKMIYNRPPLNCQKCQFRFFTDQGLERHLLGSHGLVTSSMQDQANRGKDGGRCPVCGRVYQWKLLNHVARDHNMTLKPAHLSYKCTVCTATFGMYKQFESHVYSAHSVVAKRVMDKKNGQAPSTSRSDTVSLLKPLKINDEITIIPQPAKKSMSASQRPVPGNYRVGSNPAKSRGPDSVQVIDLEDSPNKGENGSESLTAVKERLKRRQSLEIRQLESEGEDSESGGEPEQRKTEQPSQDEEDDDQQTDGESDE